MATTTISGSTVRVNTGVVLTGGTSSTHLNRLSVMNSANNHNLTDCKPNVSRTSGVQSTLKNTAVAITSITETATSTGYCAITKSSHGLAVGDKLMVEGADVAAYNTVHTVTVVTSSSEVRTDVPWTENTSTHGSYYTIKGNFAVQTKAKYVARRISTELAGISNTSLFSGGSDHGNYFAAYARGSRRYHITAFSLFTGVATKGASAGTLNKYHNIQSNNDNTTVEDYPTRAIPGRLTYRTGKAAPVSGSYQDITG